MELLAIILASLVCSLLVWFALEGCAEYLVIRSVRQQQQPRYQGWLDVCARIDRLQDPQQVARIRQQWAFDRLTIVMTDWLVDHYMASDEPRYMVH